MTKRVRRLRGVDTPALSAAVAPMPPLLRMLRGIATLARLAAAEPVTPLVRPLRGVAALALLAAVASAAPVGALRGRFAPPFLASLAPAAFVQEKAVESTVGLPARVEQVVLPAPELQAAPVDPKSPVLLRVTGTWPHGTDFRYDLEFQGFEPGEYDLARWLVRKDGGELQALPAIPVVVRAVLPAERMKPNPRTEGTGVALGGYRVLAIVVGVAWVAGVVVLLLWIRPRRTASTAVLARPRTLAERLRPLVERARANKLSRTERAELELVLYRYWKRRLGLEDTDPARALAELRSHAEAGPLLRALEDWLHRPDPEREVDVGRLLAPYQAVDDRAFDPARRGED
ncbi:MAG: hypothetical protein IPJ77_14545 [Planctomycetes bacterium]|nr:hypothetical protein [Planctomycetota bacterium]